MTLCAIVGTASLAILPFASQRMPPMPGFVPVYQSMLVLVYALTAALLFAQYRQCRATPLLVLGAGSLYVTLTVLTQLVCFPNIFAPGLLIGRGPDTLIWLWNFWHIGPPLCALPYAIMSRGGRQPMVPAARVDATLLATIAAMTLAAGATTLLAIRFVHILPTNSNVDGGYWALTTSGVGPSILILTALAFAVVAWTTRLRSVLQLWLGASLFLLLMDNVVTDLGAARDTVGWFVGRLDALVAGMVILGVYLRELGFLYRRAEETALVREQERAEAQAARESLEIALEASGMGDWELDLKTDVSYRTLRHDRIFGYQNLQTGWGRARMLKHVHPQDRPKVLQAFDEAAVDGQLEFECRIFRANDNALRWISVHGRTYFDSSGVPLSMAGCIIDVTERRHADERLRQTERLEALGQLTGGVAHDFNNLLTVILGALEIISSNPDCPPRVVRLAKSAFVAGRRGTELTEKLLSFARRQIVELETLNVNRLIGEFEVLVRRTVGETVVLETDLDFQLGSVRIDQNQFQAAVLNLAGNARDAMPLGGRLRLTTRNVVLTARDVAGMADAQPGSYARITVADTGIGMDQATAAKVFEPFFTTKEVGKGTGLGLSQVYGFARQCGGFCRVRTAPGEGCAVELYLPISAIDPPATRTNAAPLHRAAGGEVILVVEDEQDVRDMAAETLQSLGYAVLMAPDAHVAREILHGSDRVDILFSDVVMPGGINGVELASSARSLRPDLRILLTSGYTATATGGTQELPTGIPLLRKPYLKADLAAKLQVLMDVQYQ